ncbi:MAG: flagellar biosynthetic protein FliO, partial [bacterium]
TASIKEVATIPDAGIKDNGDSSIKKDVVAEEKTKNIESKIVNNEEEKKEPVKDNIKRFSTFKVILFKSVKIVGLLVGVILIIVLAWFFFKKSSENRSERRTYSPSSKQPVLSNSSTNYDNGIKLISSSPIEGDKKLLVVEVYGERLLLATSKSNITMITKLKSKEQTTEDVNYEQEAMMRSRLKDKLRNI